LDDNAGNVEIVKCGTRAGDQLQVVRAQDGTTAKAFPAGSTVEIRVTRALLDAIKLEATPQPKQQLQSVLGSTSNWTVSAIPSGTTEIDIHCDNFARSVQNAAPFLRIGNGSINTSSPYKGTQIYTNGTTGGPVYGQFLYYENKWYLHYGPLVANNCKLMVNLRLIDKDLNTWALQGGLFPIQNGCHWVTGYKSLAGILDRFEMTISSGTFSGTFNVSYR
jgi:hypothetical protein